MSQDATAEEALRDLAALLPDAVLVLVGRTVAYANENAKRLLGDPSLPLVGRSLSELLDADDLRRVNAEEEALRAGWDGPRTCRLHFRTKPRTVVADVRYVAIGRRLCLIARDAGEEVRAEELMERLAHVATNAPPQIDALGLLDATEAIFLELGWGVAFTEVAEGTSITRRVIAAEGDPVGVYGRSLIGREIPFSDTPILAQVARTGEPVFLTNLPAWESQPLSNARALSSSMKAARVARSVWCPIVDGGRLRYLLAVVGRDLTEHDSIALQLFAAQLGAAERMAALRRSQVHRERLAALGEMAATLAHEIRNPLAAITGALTVLRRGLERDPPDAGEALLAPARIIDEESQRLRRLVSDLLAFTKVAPTEPSDVDLAAAVETAVDAARKDPSLEAPSCPVRIAIDEAVVVVADPVLLHSSLVNVLANALAHARSRVDVSVSVDGHWVNVRVHNDGPSIDEGVRARVFEPFFTTRPRGTGLGLAIVRRNLAAFDAEVRLEDGGPGVTFTIRLRRWEG